MEEIIIYKIQNGDTLESIARKHEISVKELQDFHNSKAQMTKQIYGNTIPLHLEEIFVRKSLVKSLKKVNDKDNDFILKARYRCEQTVLMKLNGIVKSHADTKSEFLIEKFKKDNKINIKVELVENIIEAYDTQIELALKLICEIDQIKSSIVVNLDKNGKINKILNFDEVTSKWLEKRNILASQFDFIREKKSKSDFQTFLETIDKHFGNEKNLINDLNSKLFFDIFFDKYLVSDNFFGDYFRKYYSQLFDGYEFNLIFKQDILSESLERVKVRKVSTLDRNKLDIGFLKSVYDQKFKPLVKYSFSDYNFSLRETYIVNTQERLIEESKITIFEEVKNNVQVLIEYKLIKIDI